MVKSEELEKKIEKETCVLKIDKFIFYVVDFLKGRRESLIKYIFASVRLIKN